MNFTDVLGVMNDGGENDGLTPETEFSGWSKNPNNIYLAAYPTHRNLPKGLYDIGFSPMDCRYYARKVDLDIFRKERLYEFPNSPTQQVMDELRTFWSKSVLYEKSNITYKRGILLFGPAGVTKSSIIKQVCFELIDKHDGLVFDLHNSEQVTFFIAMSPTLKKIEKNRKIVVILEDMDALIDSEEGMLKVLTNLLDGGVHISLNNVVVLATTNAIANLPEVLTNRPSRFDLRIKVGQPDTSTRLHYLKSKFSEMEYEPKIQINDWVKASEGMSLAHLKELIISVAIMDKDFKETVTLLKQMSKLPSLFDEQAPIGFGKNGHE